VFKTQGLTLVRFEKLV